MNSQRTETRRVLEHSTLLALSDVVSALDYVDAEAERLACTGEAHKLSHLWRHAAVLAESGGHIVRAIGYYERLLSDSGASGPTRVHLARLYCQSGETVRARNMCLSVRDANLDDEARQALADVEEMLARSV